RFRDLPPKIAEQVEIDAKYDVYLSRQAADIAAYRRDESLELPDGLDYSQLRGLSHEVRQKLDAARPRTIGQAARMDGIPRAALRFLVANPRRKGRLEKAGASGRGCGAPAGLIAIQKGRPRDARGLDTIQDWLSLPIASARWR